MSRSWQVSSVPWELHDMRKSHTMHQQLVLIWETLVKMRQWCIPQKLGNYYCKILLCGCSSCFRQPHLSFGMDVLFLISGGASLLRTLDGDRLVLPRIHGGTSDFILNIQLRFGLGTMIFLNQYSSNSMQFLCNSINFTLIPPKAACRKRNTSTILHNYGKLFVTFLLAHLLTCSTYNLVDLY